MLRDIPKTAVIGGKGFLGSRFLSFYRDTYREILATHHQPSLGLIQFDLASSFFPDFSGYDYALLLGGIFNPMKCEQNPEISYFINVTQTLNLGKELLRQGVIPIFFSSDYVIEGENHYAKQKRELEKKAEEMFPNQCLIVRCTKIYGTTKGDGTLLDQMAQELMQNHRIQAAVDQMLAPIHVDDVVEGVVHLQRENKRGLFNCAGPDFVSRFDLAATLAQLLGKSKNLVTPISLDDISDGIKRPKGSFLSSAIRGRCVMDSVKEIVKNYV